MSRLWPYAAAVGFAVSPLLLDAPWRRFRILYHGSFTESLWWTLRSFWQDYPLPLSYADWDDKKDEPSDVYVPAMRKNFRAWPFLEPFFRAHGYILYCQDALIPYRYFPVPVPSPAGSRRPSDDPYPFGRKFYQSDSEPVFEISTTHVAPARTVDGHDVVIKLIHAPESPEFQALKRLNEPAVRADPRNHTIVLLDTLEFGGFTFAVMPRWDASLPTGCETIHEIFHLAFQWIEGLVFMHENRIVHGDILPQNIGTNYVCKDELKLTGAQKLGEVRHAYYDFGLAFVYPIDTVLETTQTTRWLGWGWRDLPDLNGAPYNPFKADVYFLAHALQTYVRHLEYLIPELGPFFDSILKAERDDWPMAQEMFDRFMAIYNTVPPDLLNQPMTTMMWRSGIVTMKDYKQVPITKLSNLNTIST